MDSRIIFSAQDHHCFAKKYGAAHPCLSCDQDCCTDDAIFISHVDILRIHREFPHLLVSSYVEADVDDCPSIMIGGESKVLVTKNDSVGGAVSERILKQSARVAGTMISICLWLMICSAATVVGCQRLQGSGEGGGRQAPPANRTTGDPSLPGVETVDKALDAELETYLKQKGPDYMPRTRHLNEDGSPRYTNRLIRETSPYLLQHAHNPVNWYPWGDVAFDRARRENKPVLLSVGYSTCHWCHVMERESFEDEEIAAYINEHFVAIKVDREERPDIDNVYMKAVRMMTGGGGWPMTIVMTPDREPFFGGTYFPARDGDRGVGTGFLSILKQLKEVCENDPDRVAQSAETVRERLMRLSRPVRPGGVSGPKPLIEAANIISQQFDPLWGGVGGAPKFPQPVTLELMLRYGRRTGDPRAKHIVAFTLEKMADGGIHDQIGGGFHRYSVDEKWLVPHFEKMLYDNAQLARLYLDAFQVTQDAWLEDVARDVLDYVAREMLDPSGGFYSATDADSRTPEGDDEEGYFFTWTSSEIEAVLNDEEAQAVIAYYNVTSSGNFEGRNILHTPKPMGEVASMLDTGLITLKVRLESARAKLYSVRQERPPPIRDNKILVSWNGLMVSAFARGAFVLNHPAYAARAEAAAGFVLNELRDGDGRLRRSYMDGKPSSNAYLDDYAFFVQGLLDLYESTHAVRWLDAAISLQRVLDEHFLDEQHGGYFMTSDEHEALLTREKPYYDGAEPSGNGVAALNLVRLHTFTAREAYRERAERTFAAFAEYLNRMPLALTGMLGALEFYLDRPLEVVVVLPEGGAIEEAEPLLSVLRKTYLPSRALIVTREGAELELLSRMAPVVKGRRALEGRPTAYVCEEGSCRLPTSDPKVLAGQLAAVHPLVEGDSLPPLEGRWTPGAGTAD